MSSKALWKWNSLLNFVKLCRVLSTESESHSLGGVSKQMLRVQDILTGCFKLFSSI